MLVIAKSVKGHEFLYNAKSARKVSKASSEKICSILNRVKWNLKDNEIWYIHEISEYDVAFDYAQFQAFTIRKGLVKAVNY